jgi:hypothetical protein
MKLITLIALGVLLATLQTESNGLYKKYPIRFYSKLVLIIRNFTASRILILKEGAD